MNLPGPIARMVDDELDTQVADDTENTTPPEPVQPPEDDWKKRFTGYKKSTDETLHQLRMTVAERDEHNAMMQARFEEMQREVEELRKVAKLPTVPSGVLSDEDVESLGEDNIERMAKIAKAQLDAGRKDIDLKLDAVLTRQRQLDRLEAERMQKSSDEQFWGSVRGVVPDADGIDGQPAFSDFLNSVEPYSGKPWRELGRIARQAGDVARMADIYRAFKNGAEKPGRESEVSPVGTGHGPSATGEGKKIWTRKEYQESVARLYRGGQMTADKEAKIEKIHASYLQALRERRVRD